MRFGEFLRRTDARAALVTGGVIFIAVAIQGVALYRFAAMESLEEADLRIVEWVERLESLDPGSDSPGDTIDAISRAISGSSLSARMIRDSQVIQAWGPWPGAERMIAMQPIDDGRDMGAYRLLRSGNWLSGRAMLLGGDSVEVALPLVHFAEEMAEMRQGIAYMIGVSGLIAGLVGIGTTLFVFRPLRRATRILEGVDSHRLGLRLPDRGTHDPIDVHIATLNQILSDTDAAYHRLQSFSGEVAHELRTPLNRIRNVSEVALMDGSPAELQSALEAVQSTTRELSGILQSLMLLAEISNRPDSKHMNLVDLDEWISDCLEVYAPIFDEKGVALSATKGLGAIPCERRLFDRLLVNLLENALAHSEKGDRVQIGAVRGEGRLRFWVDDSGPGIPEAERELVLEPFQRGSQSERSGSGIGLALARAIVRHHGGEIRLEESPLGGLRVSWDVPLDEPAPSGNL